MPSSIWLECIFAKKGFPRTLRLRQIDSSQDSKRSSQWHALAQAAGDLKIRIKEEPPQFFYGGAVFVYFGVRS